MTTKWCSILKWKHGCWLEYGNGFNYFIGSESRRQSLWVKRALMVTCVAGLVETFKIRILYVKKHVLQHGGPAAPGFDHGDSKVWHYKSQCRCRAPLSTLPSINSISYRTCDMLSASGIIHALSELKALDDEKYV